MSLLIPAMWAVIRFFHTAAHLTLVTSGVMAGELAAQVGWLVRAGGGPAGWLERACCCRADWWWARALSIGGGPARSL